MPRLLLTNDDGINAEGMQILRQIASSLSDDIWVVAPEEEKSASSSSLTVNVPLRLRQVDEKTFALSGTPTDCVIMALRHVMKDNLPDFILSGVNRGVNIADDIIYSGTVAGAMEGVSLGVPSFALSQAYSHDSRYDINWDVALQNAPNIIRHFIDNGWYENTVLNINFPNCALEQVNGVQVTEQGNRDQRLLDVLECNDPRGNNYYWIAYKRGEVKYSKNSDLYAISNNKISITPLHLRRTNYDALDSISNIIKSM